MKILIGNIIALIASALMVYSGYVKNKKKILIIQTIQIILFALSDLVLGGITGTIINIISSIRNILCYKGKLNIISKVILIILSVVLSLYFNNLGIIGLLPLISNILYILFMNVKNVVKFKWLLITSTSLWVVYDFSIKAFLSVGFDFMCIITNIIAIWQIKYIIKNNK